MPLPAHRCSIACSDGLRIEPLGADWYDRTVKVLIYTNSMMDAEAPLPEALYEKIISLCGDKANICLTDRGKTIIAVSRYAGKYSAIEKMRMELGLGEDEIAVFGDDFNDAEMLSGYRNSVAMGNAPDELKRIAGYVTLSNEEDGAAFALEKLLKIL